MEAADECCGVIGTEVLPAEEERAIAHFLYAEAVLLDSRRFDEWLALFDEDGYYWVPAQPAQESPQSALSLFYEHKALLSVRVARLHQRSMYAQSPLSRTHHQVSAVVARRSTEAGIDIEAASSLSVFEWRSDEGRWFAGTAIHRLRRRGNRFSMASKRVDLINCDAAHRALIVPF